MWLPRQSKREKVTAHPALRYRICVHLATVSLVVVVVVVVVGGVVESTRYDPYINYFSFEPFRRNRRRRGAKKTGTQKSERDSTTHDRGVYFAARFQVSPSLVDESFSRYNFSILIPRADDSTLNLYLRENAASAYVQKRREREGNARVRWRIILTVNGAQ